MYARLVQAVTRGFKDISARAVLILRAARLRRCQRQPLFVFHPWPDRKELVPARLTTPCRNSQQSPETPHRATHICRRNGLQIQIPANRAMRIKQVPQRYRPRIKSRPALATPPGYRSPQATKMIQRRLAPRPAKLDRMAIRTVQIHAITSVRIGESLGAGQEELCCLLLALQ